MALPVDVNSLSSGVVLRIERDQLVDADDFIHLINDNGICSQCRVVKHAVDNLRFFRADMAKISWGDQHNFAMIFYRHGIPEAEKYKRISRWSTAEMPEIVEKLFLLVSDVFVGKSEVSRGTCTSLFSPVQSDTRRRT